jgi:rfaE bifunctional protein kinase chain/domain
MLTTESVSHLFKEFNTKKVIIIGDVMIDSYIWGKVNRISPEAPVPVVEVSKREDRLGGAANVGLNIKALGAEPYLCSVIGDDNKGSDYLKLMTSQNLPINGIIKSKARLTTTKFRVIGNNTQMLRVDEEIKSYLNKEDQSNLLVKITQIIKTAGIDVIIFQDYDKGVISKELISKIVELAISAKIPVVVDPKKNNFLDYKNVNLFKPNLKEIKEGLNLDLNLDNKIEIEEAVARVMRIVNLSALRYL